MLYRLFSKAKYNQNTWMPEKRGETIPFFYLLYKLEFVIYLIHWQKLHL